MQRMNDNSFWPSLMPQKGGFWDHLDKNLGGWPGSFFKVTGPTIDMYESDQNVIVEADVPGYNEKSLSVHLTPKDMTICGKTDKTQERSGDGYLVKERGQHQFSRTISFPSDVKPEEARASYKDGVLKVTLPKEKDGLGKRSVPIQRE